MARLKKNTLLTYKKKTLKELQKIIHEEGLGNTINMSVQHHEIQNKELANLWNKAECAIFHVTMLISHLEKEEES